VQAANSYILVIILALAGCQAKKGLERSETLKAEAPQVTLTQPILEPDLVISEPDMAQEVRLDPGIVMVHKEQIDQRGQQIDNLSEEVARIRQELLLRRAAELEKESEQKKWHKAPPQCGKSRDHYQEWRYMQQNQKVLGLEGQVHKDGGAILVPAPEWRVE